MKAEVFEQFERWLSEAHDSEPSLAEAVCLSTVSADGWPSSRMVLHKGLNADGFVFYTNLQSRKASELMAQPRAALCFHWKSLKRQVRVEGEVVPVSESQADAYFASRSRGSQLGAWASKQSQVLPSRFALESAVAHYTARFGIGAVPRPKWWSGFVLQPRSIEFWEELPFRLHRRRRHLCEEGEWRVEALYP